jgi:hypothetical protein
MNKEMVGVTTKFMPLITRDTQVDTKVPSSSESEHIQPVLDRNNESKKDSSFTEEEYNEYD